MAENNMPWMKEIEGSWGDEANALVPSVQMILFCQVDGTRKQYSFISPRSAFHRGNSIEKKKRTVSALKYIGWNETLENSASSSLSDLMLFSIHETTL